MRASRRAPGATLLTILLLVVTAVDRSEADGTADLSAEDRAVLTALLGEGVIGNAVVARAIDTPTEWYPLEDGVLTYDITGGRASGSTQEHVVQRLQDEPLQGSVRQGEDAVLYLGVAADGTIVIEAEETLGAKRVSRFTPPEPLVPAGMKVGDTTDAETDVAVYSVDRPDRVKHTGALRVSCRYLGAFEVGVPSGRYTAALLKSTFEGKIGPATVQETEYRFLARGVGTVAMVVKRNNSAVLVYRDRFEIGKVLAGHGKQARPPSFEIATPR
jgi:hypothetical protein